MNYRVLTLALIGIAPVQAAIASVPRIYLECKVQSTHEFSTGGVYRDNGSALVEIQENERNILIRVSSSIPAVNNLSAGDLPGETSTPKTARGEKNDTRIFIDRVTGTLIITNLYEIDNGHTTLSVSGSCEKSSGQKKF
jgi:hypothetical protein